MAKRKTKAAREAAMEAARLFRRGYALKDVRALCQSEDLPCGAIRQIRDEVYHILQTSPGAVIALADGPILNANVVNRYTQCGQRKAHAPPVQLSILDIVDGHMGRTA